MLIAAIHQHPGLSLMGALASRESSFLESDAGSLANCGELGVAVSCEMETVLTGSRVLIDFSVTEVVQDLTRVCVRLGVGMVIGTTGHSTSQRNSIEEAARTIPIVLAPNMSVGVNVTLKMVELATRALDSKIDVEILETHHRNKVDAPSGTAVRIGELIADTRNVELNDVAVHGREGMTGQRSLGAIGFHSARGGDVVGEHTVFFLGQGERVEISHRATDRAIFANGATRASLFVEEKLQLGSSGLYDMDDVLGLS